MATWNALAPKPFRGDLIAAGAASLSVGLVLLDTRVQDDWPVGVRFVLMLAGAALLLTMAWLAPVEGHTPRMYVSALLVSAFPLLAFALLELADLLGGSASSAGTLTWVAFALGATCIWMAWTRGSPIATFLGAASWVVALLAAWTWIFDPDSPTGLQWLCLVMIAGLAVQAIRQRDRHRPHAVALVDVAGLTALLLAGLLSIDAAFDVISDSSGLLGANATAPGVGWGWKLVLLAVGFGLVAYGAVDRERGPIWLGVAVLIAFVLLAGEGNLLWWPLILLLLGGLAIAAGLRPTTAAPPSPDLDAPEAPTRPFDPPPDPFL